MAARRPYKMAEDLLVDAIACIEHMKGICGPSIVALLDRCERMARYEVLRTKKIVSSTQASSLAKCSAFKKVA
jgi:hypothetical protein